MMAMTMNGSTVLHQSCGRAPACRKINNSPLCCAPTRSLNCKSTFRGGDVARYNHIYQRSTQQRCGRSLVVRAGLGDVGKYLSEAAAAVFSPTKEDVPWSGGRFCTLTCRWSCTQPSKVELDPACSQVTSLAKCPTMKEMCLV